MLSRRQADEAEDRADGAIEAACLVMSPDLERRGPWDGGPWLLLVLTTDELLFFALSPAGWRHPNTAFIDTELMRVPLSQVARFSPLFSINPLVKAFGLAFTDGKRMTLRVGRGSWNRHGDVPRSLMAVGTSG
jgi:hypothetical protein